MLISPGIYAQEEDLKTLMEQDWANLKKYREANKVLIEKKDFPDVVFMGNSITEGWYHADPAFFKDHNFINRGISGQTTPQMLLRFKADVIDLRPKAVVILAGTNDIAGNTGYSSVKMITDNIQSMAQLAKANNITVVLCTILPVFDYSWRPGLEPVPKIDSVNSWLKKYAEKNGHFYVDYHTAMVNEKKGMKAEFSEDGVHPNAEGYVVMKPIVLHTIDQVLENRK